MSNDYTQTLFHSEEAQSIIGDLQSYTHHTQVPNLGDFQRILLQADGTVTAILEAYLNEQIQVVKLSESIEKIKLELPNIKLNHPEEVMVRKILLQGKISQRNFIYADSFILINNLEKRFSHELLETNKPIGKLWSEQKVETFKEIIHSGIEPANELANYFCIKPEENLIVRTYSVSSQGKITMIITEKFPKNYFPKVL